MNHRSKVQIQLRISIIFTELDFRKSYFYLKFLFFWRGGGYIWLINVLCIMLSFTSKSFSAILRNYSKVWWATLNRMYAWCMTRCYIFWRLSTIKKRSDQFNCILANVYKNVMLWKRKILMHLMRRPIRPPPPSGLIM